MGRPVRRHRLPSTLPIFPLPNVVLFPHVLLPLHIFEPRYREMVEAVLDDHGLIGMVLLKPGFEADYDGRPPVYSVGCAGVITHHTRLDDGRYNLVLQGIEKFRVTGEDESRAYRLAHVEALPELRALPDIAALRQRRNRLDALVARSIERRGGTPRLTETTADDALVNALSQYLDLEPAERQHLLEQDGVVARADSLIELLEMRLRAGDAPGPPPGAVH